MNKLLLVWFVLITQAFAEPVPGVSGAGYKLAADKLLYRELHFFSVDGSRHVIIYQPHEGEQMATKTLRYSAAFSMVLPAGERWINKPGLSRSFMPGNVSNEAASSLQPGVRYFYLGDSCLDLGSCNTRPFVLEFVEEESPGVITYSL